MANGMAKKNSQGTVLVSMKPTDNRLRKYMVHMSIDFYDK
jgi:hypothetical protein